MKVLIPLLVPLFLFGCFGTDDNSSTSLSGTVADGYIENATVCFDSNGNLSCDDGEPTTTTAADGSYSVTANGSVDGLSVIAVVGPESKDADDGGQTMAEAGKEGFNFMAPAANPKVVSPLSTLVQFEIISNPDFSLAEAQGAVKETLGIDNDNVNLLEYDFVKEAESGDSFATNIKNVTEVLSSALGDVTKNMSDDSAIADLKAGGDDGMKAFQTGIMDMIKETVIPQTVAGGAVTGTVDDIKKQLKGAFRPNDCGANDCNKTGSLVSGFQTAVTAKKKAVKVAATAGAQTVSDAKAIIENGIVIGWNESAPYFDDNGTKARYKLEGLFIEYIKMSSQGGYDIEKVLIGNAWKNTCGDSYFDMTMNPNTGDWSLGETPGGHEAEAEPTFSGGCMNFKALGKFTQKICMKERDLSGKVIKDVMCPDGTNTSGDNEDDFCNAMDGKSTKFASGSKGLDVSMSHDYDLYRANIDSCVFEQNASCTTGYFDADDNRIMSVDKLVEKFAAGTKTGYAGENCNIAFSFANKQILFAENENGCNASFTTIQSDDEDLEKLNYTLKTVGNSKVLVSGLPQFYVKNYPEAMPVGAKLLFASVPTGVSTLDQPQKDLAPDNISHDTPSNPTGIITTSGTYVPIGVSRKFSFDTGDEKIGTYQFLDSIIDVQGWDAFPYPTSPTSDSTPGVCAEME